MKQSLSERILAYYRANSGEWIAKGKIERLVVEKTTYTADNAGRRLRELAECGMLETKLVKGHAFYKYVPQQMTIERIEVHGDTAYKIKENIQV